MILHAVIYTSIFLLDPIIDFFYFPFQIISLPENGTLFYSSSNLSDSANLIPRGAYFAYDKFGKPDVVNETTIQVYYRPNVHYNGPDAYENAKKEKKRISKGIRVALEFTYFDSFLKMFSDSIHFYSIIFLFDLTFTLLFFFCFLDSFHVLSWFRTNILS